MAGDVLAGGGEMGALIRSMDWSQTPIGPVESWSPTLRMMARFLVANRFPLLLWWGPQYVSIYNDPYRPVLGTKHPWALGKPVYECWSEIWHILQPLIDTPFNGGPATWNDDIFLEINRYGFVEETHFTIAYSPVPDDTVPSGIGGVLATVHEITEKVGGERRVVALRDLGARVGDAKTADAPIPAADLPRIFERFHRGANVAGEIAGSGIGLASARQIVEQHGGSITVESREATGPDAGSGSTFTVRLPLSPPIGAPPAAADAPGAVSEHAGRGRRPRR